MPDSFDEAREAIMQGAVRLYQGVNTAEAEANRLRNRIAKMRATAERLEAENEQLRARLASDEGEGC